MISPTTLFKRIAYQTQQHLWNIFHCQTSPTICLLICSVNLIPDLTISIQVPETPVEYISLSSLPFHLFVSILLYCVTPVECNPPTSAGCWYICGKTLTWSVAVMFNTQSGWQHIDPPPPLRAQLTITSNHARPRRSVPLFSTGQHLRYSRFPANI